MSSTTTQERRRRNRGAGIEDREQRMSGAAASSVIPRADTREKKRANRRGRRLEEPSTYRGRRRPGGTSTTTGTLSAAELTRRVPFLVIVLVLIGIGVGATLWFSAQSTRETYALRTAQEHNVMLKEQKEELVASIERSRSAEELARRAEQLGLMSVSSAPILVRGSDGEVEIIGEELAELGAPITPLQPAPVASEPGQAEGTDRFEAPSAQVAPDSAPVGEDPRPDMNPVPDRQEPSDPELPRLMPAPEPPPPAEAPEGLQPVPGT